MKKRAYGVAVGAVLGAVMASAAALAAESNGNTAGDAQSQPAADTAIMSAASPGQQQAAKNVLTPTYEVPPAPPVPERSKQEVWRQMESNNMSSHPS
ncbi:MAG: hypothetical protein L0H83_02070 [Salinisphaera sp.]|nr:hypothetical protein [Salinisphaera sp.]